MNGAEKGSPVITAADALSAAREILPWMIEIRRDLHQHPELGLEEHRTAARIQGWLDELGVAHRDGLGGTGVLGWVGAGERAVALRADIDALPIQDAKKAAYRSRVDGKMHACGHDAHTTVLLGAARILTGLAPRLPGMVKLLFQPAEETVGGAELMIEAGVLEEPPVAAVFGLHVDANVEAGAFAVRYGQRNASSDAVKILIHGASCHAAYPAGGVDAIVVAAQVVTALQTIVSRNVDGRDSAVVTFGTVRGGTQANIVADRVELVGTVRTLDPAIRETVLARIRTLAENVAEGFGASAEVEVESGYPALINDDAMVRLVQDNAESLVGGERVMVLPGPNMGVEDFAYYLHRVPGAFFTLGVGNEDAGIVHDIHQPLFDIDESSLAYGAALQVLNAVSALAATAGAPEDPKAAC